MSIRNKSKSLADRIGLSANLRNWKTTKTNKSVWGDWLFNQYTEINSFSIDKLTNFKIKEISSFQQPQNVKRINSVQNA